MLVAGLGQIDRALLLVELVILAGELRDDRVDADVEVGAVLGRAGNDERRARLVDQDRIDLVDDGEGMAALHHLRHVVFHVVAQIVEAELVVGAVGDVGGVGLAALVVVEAVDDDADGHAEELVDLAHPLGVAAGEIVVDGDDVHALAGERVEIDGERRDQRLAFAGAHLGDRALVQHQAADQLNVEMALLERALGGLAHGGESGRDQIVERLAGGELGAELGGLGAQLIVAQRVELGLQRVDRGDLRPIALQPAVVGRAEDPLHHRVELQRRAEHFRPFQCRPARRRWRRLPLINERAMGARATAATTKSAKKARTPIFAPLNRVAREIGAAPCLVNDGRRRLVRLCAVTFGKPDSRTSNGRTAMIRAMVPRQRVPDAPQSFAVVDREDMLEIAEFAIGLAVIAQGRAAGLDRFLEDVADRLGERGRGAGRSAARVRQDARPALKA